MLKSHDRLGTKKVSSKKLQWLTFKYVNTLHQMLYHDYSHSIATLKNTYLQLNDNSKKRKSVSILLIILNFIWIIIYNFGFGLVSFYVCFVCRATIYMVYLMVLLMLICRLSLLVYLIFSHILS